MTFSRIVALATVACIVSSFIGPTSALPKGNAEPPGASTTTPWYFGTPEAAGCAQGDPPVAVRLDAGTYYSSEAPEYSAYRRYACASIAKLHGLKPPASAVASVPFRPVQLTLRVDAVGNPPFVPPTIALSMNAVGRSPFVPVLIKLDVRAYGAP